MEHSETHTPTANQAKWHEIEILEPFIDPRWFRVWYGSVSESVVTSSGTLVIDGVELGRCPYPTGTRVSIKIGSPCLCISVDDLRVVNDSRTRRFIQEQLKEFSQEGFRSLELLDGCYNLALPFLWTAARIDNLSGLTETSFGDGCKANSVKHILAQEDIRVGRLVRAAGTYLCKADMITKGNYSGTNATPLETEWEGRSIPSLITCKKCLKLAAIASKGLLTHN